MQEYYQVIKYIVSLTKNSIFMIGFYLLGTSYFFDRFLPDRDFRHGKVNGWRGGLIDTFWYIQSFSNSSGVTLHLQQSRSVIPNQIYKFWEHVQTLSEVETSHTVIMT